MRVLVVGRGVFGLGGALALAGRGHQVIVVGPRDPAAASEDSSRIIRNDYGADRFHASWAEEAIAGWHRWNVTAPVPLFHDVGLANLSLSPMSVGSFVGDSAERVDGVERRDALAITQELPFLAPGLFVDGYRNPAAGWAAASEAVRWMERMCEEAGVGIVPERVARIGDGWVGLADDGLLRADVIVVAAGAWTPGLVPETADLLVVAGQPVLYLQPADPSPFSGVPVWALDLATTGFYGFPATDDGIVKVGHHGRGVTRRLHTRSVPEGVVGAFRRFFRQAVPALAAARVHSTRVCHYTDAPGGRFLIDRVPGRPGIVIAAGGSGHGFKFAPVIGETIAAVVLGEVHPRRSAVSWRPAGAVADPTRSAWSGGADR